VLPEEAERPQPFDVDLDLLTELGAAGASDDVTQTVDYGALCEVVRSVVEGDHVMLLERLAEQVAEGALSLAGGHARGVVVAVRKLRPPVPFDLASAGVRIYRQNKPVDRQATTADRADAVPAPGSDGRGTGPDDV